LQGFLSTHVPEHLPLLPALGAGVLSMAEERRRRATAIRQAASAVSKSDPSAATAAYLALFGDEAPIWDVSVPTYAEDPSAFRLDGRAAAEEPAAVDWRAADEEVAAALGESDRQTWRRLLPLAREAIALSEADDWIYARAQAVVRRALLGLGRELQRAGRLADASDVFFLPLPLVRNLCRGEAPTADLAGLTDLAAGGRTAWQSARKNPPSAAITADDVAVRGHGTGGHAIGRVALHRSGSFRSCAADTVLLAHTLLPTELPLVTAAAIVTETGGPLDHVAAQARERGIPAVIGAAGATSILDEGDLVLVDGERGLVVRLARA
jgi:pyruvate,water dikinase